MRHLFASRVLATLRQPAHAFTRRARAISSASKASLIQELQHRGLVESITGADGQLDTFVSSNKATVYAGVDATASSMHVGHLLPLMNLLHFYINGHHSISVVGKATAAVGDPSGRASERDALAAERLKNQFSAIWAQIDRFFQTGRTYALQRGYAEEKIGTREQVTNSEWLDGMGLVEFLGSVGRQVRVGQMLARESVKARMESAQGINYAEFTYQLLQSYDFWHLYHHKNCRIQVGGNDQYGNITAGIDLISRLNKAADLPIPSAGFDYAYGLTVPLLTTASGEKFGKSAGNAVWLDEELTTPFELYQYFVRLPDEVVGAHLKKFTLLSRESIDEAMNAHTRTPESRGAQRLLAKEVVTLIHGASKAESAEIQTRVLFPISTGDLDLSAEQVLRSFSNSERLCRIAKSELIGEPLSKVLVKTGAARSRSEAVKLVKGGGVYVGSNNVRAQNSEELVHEGLFLDAQVLLIRVGKGKFTIAHAT